MLEGKFSGEGLQALNTDEDLMSAMARELVEKAGVGESANAVWRELDHEREKFQPRPIVVEAEPKEEFAPVLELPLVPATQTVPLTFGMHLMEPPPNEKKRKKLSVRPTATEQRSQLSLFD